MFVNHFKLNQKGQIVNEHEHDKAKKPLVDDTDYDSEEEVEDEADTEKEDEEDSKIKN